MITIFLGKIFMALILIRGESNSKLLSAITDMENHGDFNIVSDPKVIDSAFADFLVEGILNSRLRTTSRVATAFFVKEDSTLSILQIKKIHPPAHVVVVSNEYRGYDELKKLLISAKPLQGYHSTKAKNEGMIDYKIGGENRFIKNNKLNSYANK